MEALFFGWIYHGFYGLVWREEDLRGILLLLSVTTTTSGLFILVAFWCDGFGICVFTTEYTVLRDRY